MASHACSNLHYRRGTAAWAAVNGKKGGGGGCDCSAADAFDPTADGSGIFLHNGIASQTASSNHLWGSSMRA